MTLRNFEARRHIASLALAIAIALAQVEASIAQPQQPPRDRRAPVPAVGTARIRGIVMSADTGAPLRSVQLSLSASNPRITKVATTDQNGQYEFNALPAGRYSLLAQKPGYVSMRFGAAGPLHSGKPIELAAGQTLTGITVALPRGNVITGRVTDEFGEPVLDAIVRVMRYESSNGQRRLIPVGRSRQTDDLGEYRIFGLLPGNYYVTAVAREPEGRSDAVQDPETVEPPQYAPTFYPGTADIARAQRVTVGVGDTRPNIDVMLIRTRTARISGLATDSEGRSIAGARVLLARREGGVGFRATLEARVKTDGSFEVKGVAPGSYVLEVFPNPIGTERVREVGFLPVQVSGSDIERLIVRTSRGGTARGQLVAEGRDASRFPLSRVEITARLSVSNDASAGRSATTRLSPDGSFELRGMVGPQVIRALNLPTGWTLKSVTLGGEEITDAGVEFKPGATATGLRVVVADRATELKGTVSGCQTLADRGCSVLVFSSDSSRWGPQTRFVRITQPGPQGAYSVRGLPGGSYLAIAIPYVWQGEWYDTEFLDSLRPHAITAILADGQSQTLNLAGVPLLP